jgi:hypothetical protein
MSPDANLKGPISPPPIPERDLAVRWGKSIRTLQRLRRDGHGPAFLRIGGCIYYLAADIEAFEQASRKNVGVAQ